MSEIYLEKGMRHLRDARDAMNKAKTSLDLVDDEYLYANAMSYAGSAISYFEMNLYTKEKGSPEWLEAKKKLDEANDLHDEARLRYDNLGRYPL